MNFNKAHIVGRLTRDPEPKSLPSGMAVTTFSVATSETRTNKEGEKTVETEYHNIVAFGKLAETTGKYLNKGNLVLVTGKLKTRNWEKDGVKHYRTEVIADNIVFGPVTTPQEETPGAKAVEYPEDEINPEDIPF